MAKRPKAAEAAPPIGSGRLAGKIALITGAAGNIGGHIVAHYLAEGATVVLTGRTRARIDAAAAKAASDAGVDADRVMAVLLDGGDMASVRAAIEEVIARFGRIDILVNNAGSAGPKAPLEALPLDAGDLDALRKGGSTDTETVKDALRNIFGVAWNVTRAVAPHMPEGGSVVNVSTIFSRTPYYARTAYVVPKAAMNAWSRELSLELGPRGIRVNLVFPGPIASERIRSVFATMDGVRGDPAGTTQAQFFDMMALERAVDDAPRAKTFPTPEDVARTCVFVGSDESAAFTGHDFEVTHGMTVRKESRSTYLSRPTMRSMDGAGLAVLIAAGDAWEDALELAKVQLAAGARVLLGLSRQADVAIAAARAKAESIGDMLEIVRFNRTEPKAMEATLADYTGKGTPITGALFMPFHAPGEFSGSLVSADDDLVERWLDIELFGAIALARTLSRYWKTHDTLLQSPRFVFLSNPADGGGDVYANMMRAAREQLIRIWRDESAIDVTHGWRRQAEWGNQIVRFTNDEPENIRFTAGHAARILLKESKLNEINLYLPPSIGEATGARVAMPGFSENITGLHLGKVALITGGSAGIGGQVARLLALAGAKVMMVARRDKELALARARLVAELEDIGFAGVERRVQTIVGDVADFDSLRRAADATIAAFGRIDYLINNAGVAGAEDMVVDMDVDAWRYTLDANLVSNYALMDYVVPRMKAQGAGYVLNVSSYFGGEKYLAVAYPNRADYAVSKSGQRAMVESLARYLGPEVQFNAIAPGPVAGDRLAGTGGKPGLFERRGKLILENKRLNAVHAAAIRAIRRGTRVEAVLARLARNDTVRMSHDTQNPRELRDLALECAREGDGVCTWDRHLMTPEIAGRLVRRLRQGGYFLDSPDWTKRPATPEADANWLLRTPAADKPFLPADKIAAEAEKVGSGVTRQLYLGKMPSEADVAQATVFFLADRAVSGETFMPSGGLNVERSTTERELFGGPKQERLDQMRGRTVWLIGEHLTDYLAEAARAFAEDCHVAHVVLITKSATGADALREALSELPAERLTWIDASGEGIEAAMDQASIAHGRPITIVSTPLGPLPHALFDGDEPLSTEGFRAVVDANLTHHFRVARKASLYDGCQLVLVSPDVGVGDKSAAFALANFLKTTLHAFTATLAVENERLVHDVPVNQINLTRRVRSEEPRDLDEHIEEVKRFARAVLLLGAPLPDAEDSRYRARIYRGMSMTV